MVREKSRDRGLAEGKWGKILEKRERIKGRRERIRGKEEERKKIEAKRKHEINVKIKRQDKT